MCESLKKFESKRPGVLSGRRNPPTTAQYTLTISTLHTTLDKNLPTKSGLNIFSRSKKRRTLSTSTNLFLAIETSLKNAPFSSNKLIATQSVVATKLKRNKTRAMTVDTSDIIPLFQFL